MRRGFTLIELLVVMAIIAILTAMIIPTIGIIKRKSTETRCRALLLKVATAIEAYQQDSKAWPISSTTMAANWAQGDWDKVKAVNALIAKTLLTTDTYTSGARTLRHKGYLIGELRPSEIQQDASTQYIIDPWGQPLIYYGPDWPGKTTGTVSYTGNATHFELWSAGPDVSFTDLRANSASSSADPDRDNLPAQPYDPSLHK